MPNFVTVDGNEATARIAYALSEVVAIYPITPASPMGELADAWSQAGKPNLWGSVPEVVQMQSEAGAAGAVHGSLQAGALTTTFTASQGLLLMLPNMYKIAGELTPTVFHVAARTVASHALSIFGDHSDVMAARPTGFALLASSSVQEALDMALVAHAATLRSRVPFLHFFDGFRTSHEVTKIESIEDSVLAEMIDDDLIAEHRLRSLNPNHPVLRGTAQNPDVFFQAREAANPYYLGLPELAQAEMDKLASHTGRRHHLFDYHGDPEAERVIVIMGSGSGAAREAVDRGISRGDAVGVVTVRLYRPFLASAFREALPATTRTVAVLDRTKEPGSTGEPLYQDVVTVLAETSDSPPLVVGGRYGLSSKEFTPSMAEAVLEEAAASQPRRHFTVGITDDVTHLSLNVEDGWDEPKDQTRAVFFGLGSDGTVGAAKNSVKIISDHTPLFAQGYFVYDSKKAGAVTVSHMRIGAEPITSSYLVDQAGFVACHQFNFLERLDVMGRAAMGAKFLLNSPYSAEDVWDQLPVEIQAEIIDKEIEFWVVDGSRVAREAGLGGRINTVLQTCFFALSGVLPADEAVEAIKESIRSTYGKRGETVLRRNFAAVDGALDALARVDVPAQPTSTRRRLPPVPEQAPDFVQRITSMMISGQGDLLPVSALPVDGTFPTGTAQWEKRNIAVEIPIWDPDICIDCGRCALVCPHAAIRMKLYEPSAIVDSPPSFLSREWEGRDFAGMAMTIQVAPDDCTGCGVCVDICPAKSKEVAKHKSLDMAPKLDHLETERTRYEYFLSIPEMDRSKVRPDTVKGSQMLEPLFEYSGACAGCGETPYLKLLTQLFGDRIVVANATGCSSIFGGNLPTTPWSSNKEGRGPAWSNSLFEDNAEFGLGMRLALDQHKQMARSILTKLAVHLEGVAEPTLTADQSTEAGIAAQRSRVEMLRVRLQALNVPEAKRLATVADSLIDSSIWIVGGDGWAYDIGFGGLDHVLASGRNVNILVLDTEVYSNTGGQASKATPRAAVAKFASGGKSTAKKDLGMFAMGYGDVYVAQIAMGANMTQTVKALAEAEAHKGPSLIIAYSPCIVHGIEMSTMMSHQKEAAESGYWPLFRYDPELEKQGKPALRLDSRKPTLRFKEFAMKEARFAMLARSNPVRAATLLAEAQHDIENRWHLYEQMVHVERTAVYEEVSE